MHQRVARALGSLSFVLVAIAAVSAASAGCDRIRALSHTSDLAIRAIAFGLIARTLLSGNGHSRAVIIPAGAWKHVLAAGVVIAVALSAAGSRLTPLSRLAWLAAVFAAGAVEEIVFRLLLPQRIASDLAPGHRSVIASLLAVVLAQVAFATGHFLSTWPPTWDPVRFGHLVTAGLALWAVVHGAGLWLAVSLHALANIWLSESPQSSMQTRGVVPLMLGAAGAASLGYRWCRRWSQAS